MNLSKRAQAFRGKTVELVKTGERGTIVHVTDAGFAGLMFKVELEDGEQVVAYGGDIQVVPQPTASFTIASGPERARFRSEVEN